MKCELKKLVFLLSLVSGAAVSVYSADLLAGKLPEKGDLRFTLDAEGSYISDIYQQNSEHDAFAGALGVGAGYSFLKGLDLSFRLPFYADMLNSRDVAGMGDLDIDLFWLPLTNVPVSPVFSLKNTIPTGSDNGLIPRAFNLCSGDFSYYSYDDYTVMFALGIDIDLSQRAMPLRLNYTCAPRIVFAGDIYTTVTNRMGFQWFASDYIIPGLSFLVETPAEGDDLFEESSYELSAYLKISPSTVLDIQTDFTFGLGDASVERGGNQFPVVPLFTFGLTFDFYRRGGIDSVASTGVDTLPVSMVVDTLPAQVIIADEDTLDADNERFIAYSDSDNDGIYDSLDLCPEAPELYNYIKDDDGCPDFDTTAASAVATSYVLEGVEFSSGSTSLSYESKTYLAGLLDMLKKDSNMRIELRGFSDYSGGYVTNINISRKRAESVMDYLLSAGVGKHQLQAVGYGPNSPVADNRTPKGRRKNRRIEYVILN